MLTFYHLALPSAPLYFETRSHCYPDRTQTVSALPLPAEVAASAGMYFRSLLLLPLNHLSCDLVNILYYFIILMRKIPVLVSIHSLLNACMNNVPTHGH